MTANAAQVAALAVRLRLRPRQVRVALTAIAAVRAMPQLTTDDYRMRACDVVLATGLVESSLTIYANGHNGESMNRPHEAVGWDHGSVGFLQQQVGGAANSTADWGTTAQCMDVGYATRHFVRVLIAKTYNGLRWTKLSNGVAAQMVQGSAFPDRYAQRDAQAISIRKTLWPYATPGTVAVKPTTPKPAPHPKPTPAKAKVVTVGSGQNMGGIARGNGISLERLEQLNPHAGHPAGNFNVIWPGDKLRVR